MTICWSNISNSCDTEGKSPKVINGSKHSILTIHTETIFPFYTIKLCLHICMWCLYMHYICMYAFMCTHTYVCTCLSTIVCIWRWKDKLRCHSSSSTLFVAAYARSDDLWASPVSISRLAIITLDYKHVVWCTALHEFWGHKPKVPCVCLHILIRFPIPPTTFKIKILKVCKRSNIFKQNYLRQK